MKVIIEGNTFEVKLNLLLEEVRELFFSLYFNSMTYPLEKPEIVWQIWADMRRN